MTFSKRKNSALSKLLESLDWKKSFFRARLEDILGSPFIKGYLNAKTEKKVKAEIDNITESTLENLQKLYGENLSSNQIEDIIAFLNSSAGKAWAKINATKKSEISKIINGWSKKVEALLLENTRPAQREAALSNMCDYSQYIPPIIDKKTGRIMTASSVHV